MKHAKIKMSFAAAVVASIMTLHIGVAQARLIVDIVDSVTATALSPFLTTTAGFMSSTASTAAKQREAYLAAAGEAAHFVDVGGEAAMSPLLTEVIGFEKSMIEHAIGTEAASSLQDIHYARLVVVRTEQQFKQAF